MLTILVAAGIPAVGCRDEAARAPTPTAYDWPDSFAFLVEIISETRADTAALARYEEREALRFAVRDERYLVWHDSVVKESFGPGATPVVEPYQPEDTVHYYVSLSRRGRASGSEPACDPAVPACHDVLPSALPLELSRLIPRLPVWEAPRGQAWSDTLVYDDTPRPRGTRGSLVTTYRMVADTIIGGAPVWKIAWGSERRSFVPAAGPAGLGAVAPVQESGVVYIDKSRRVPVFAMWGGGAAAPAALRAAGVTGTGYRGRAYLVGSVVERLLAPAQ